eukprot:Pgem_evm1s19685
MYSQLVLSFTMVTSFGTFSQAKSLNKSLRDSHSSSDAPVDINEVKPIFLCHSAWGIESLDKNCKSTCLDVDGNPVNENKLCEFHDYSNNTYTVVNEQSSKGNADFGQCVCNKNCRANHKQYFDLYTGGYVQDEVTCGWDVHPGGGLSWSNDWDYLTEKMGMTFTLINITNHGNTGGVRTAHWHDNADEITYVISGEARVSITRLPLTNLKGNEVDESLVADEKPKRPYDDRRRSVNQENSQARAFVSYEQMQKDREKQDLTLVVERPTETFTLKAGDAFYARKGYSHYFESVGNEDFIGIAIFNTKKLRTFDLPQVTPNLDDELLARAFGIDVEDFKKLGLHNAYNENRTVMDPPTKKWFFSPETLTDYNAPVFKLSGITRNQKPHPRTHGKTRTSFQNRESLFSEINFAYTEIDAGSYLEPYWVDNCDEFIYVQEGGSDDTGKVVMSQANQINPGVEGHIADKFELKMGMMTICGIGDTCSIENNSSSTVKMIRAFNCNAPTVTTLYDSVVGQPDDTLASEYGVTVEQTKQLKNNFD